MTRIPAWLSGLVLTVVTALGGGYLAVGVLGHDPAVRRNTAEVRMAHAAGLRTGSEVVYRGVDIGAVRFVRSVRDGVLVGIEYDAAYRIPEDSALAVENLSALGEPVFAFLPGAGTGRYLADGARLAGTVAAPTAVPELLAGTSTLLDQVDSAAVGRLVETFAVAVDGAGAVTPALARAADLLAATLAGHQPALETVLRDLMRLMPELGWVKPVLTAAPPQLDKFGATLGVSYEYLFEGSVLLRGEEVLGSWRAEEAQLVDFLRRFAPELGALGVALRPLTTAVGPTLGAVDLATLLDHTLASLPGDRLRLTLTPPAPEGPP